ncbi:MAG: DUF4861 family protein [Bacteroidaceae bacterium]|nr:DUF4861 family protein [Bacteroidaceae bacterium]
MRHLSLLTLFTLLTACPALRSQTFRISVGNPSAYARTEVVEVALQRLGHDGSAGRCTAWRVLDGEGRAVASQVTHDGKLLFAASIAAKGRSAFTAAPGEPPNELPAVFVKVYPQRLDDIAWENDRMAYRAYGPALQRSGERSFGYDVWVKNTSRPVVDERYRRELDPVVQDSVRRLRKTQPKAAKALQRSVSYHVDHGNGMDCYKVGPTLGCGTPALLTPQDRIAYPWCYQDIQVLDSGPLRITFRARHAPQEPSPLGTYTEVRTLSLDRHALLNRLTVSYTPLPHRATMAAGIVVHPDDTPAYALRPRQGYMLYSDPTDNPRAGNGRIFTACVFPRRDVDMAYRPLPPNEQQQAKALGHLLAMRTAHGRRTTMTYWWGAAWSKAGTADMQQWERQVAQEADRLRHPLRVKVKRLGH